MENRWLKAGLTISSTLLLLLMTSSMGLAATDSNPSNNNVWILVNTTSTRHLSIDYVLISDGNGTYSDQDTVNTIISEGNKFIKATFPLADDGLENLWTSENQLRVDVNDLTSSTDNDELWIKNRVLNNLQRIALTKEPQPEIMIGIMPNGSIHDLFGGEDSIGFGNKGYYAGVIEDGIVYPSGKGEYQLTAHEIGHTYGLCDEYSTFTWLREYANYHGCPNGDDEGIFGLDSSCSEEDVSFSNREVHACQAPAYKELNPHGLHFEPYHQDENGFDVLRNFMGSVQDFSDHYWISTSSYQHLLEEFNKSSASEGESLLISGIVYRNGTYEIDASYEITSTRRVYVNETGNFSIKIKNGNTTVFATNFTPTFMISGENGSEESNLSSFVFTVPYDNNITSIEFLYLGFTQELINKSPITPSITLLSPIGGEVFTDPFNVTWNASDADNDTLLYLVQVSDDNGSSWSTLAVDVNETFWTLDNADFSYGTQYKVKVWVTDGFNTNTTESASNFTIVPPPSVAVEGLSALSGAHEREVYESIILNDGGQTLPELAWMFDTGESNISNEENVSLALNERLFVLVEYNYSSGGSMNVSLFAYDNNQSVNDTASMLVFVGDLRVGSSQELSSNSTRRLLETVISNAGETLIDGVSWNVSTGDVNVSSVHSFNLSANEEVFLLFEHDYSDTGDYLAEITVTDGFNTVEDAISVEIPDISVEQFQVVSQVDEAAVFEFKLKNDLNDPMNASWMLDTGDELVVSSQNTTLAVGERVFVLVASNYTSFGDFTAELNATDGNHVRQTWRAVSIPELTLQNLVKLSSNGTLAVFSFDVGNQFSKNRSFNWSFDTDDSLVIDAVQPITLEGAKNATILIEHNYSSTGSYNFTATANTTAGSYEASLETSI